MRAIARINPLTPALSCRRRDRFDREDLVVGRPADRPQAQRRTWPGISTGPTMATTDTTAGTLPRRSPSSGALRNGRGFSNPIARAVVCRGPERDA